MHNSNDLDHLAAYDYALPETLIAQHPCSPRDESRLLVVDRNSGRCEHRTFKDLVQYLSADDLMIANNTQVFRARLLGHRLLEHDTPGGKVELLLLEEVSPGIWEGAFHAAAKHKPGVRFRIPTPDGRGMVGELVRGASESASGTVWAKFDRDPIACGAGVIPLPHYIRRDMDAGADLAHYQTVYAKHPGSAAAPTAGLHFTDSVMREIRAKGALWEEITLHVGLGTFRPVKSEDIRQHVMHEERYEIASGVAAQVNHFKHAGKRIFAVGTTSVRTLESAWIVGEGLRAGAGRTSLFVYPGCGSAFHVVDRLLTNFHLPRSTLLMLVCALGGKDLVMDAYREAVREKYRFFSYGDAMLVI